jgi:mevalonate pyrophosphate decarboxylase
LCWLRNPSHHPDIARYWGKRDTSLILPTNSSLSVTLDQDHLRSTTTSRADASFEKGDRLWLNGTEESIKEGGRLAVCIKELRGWRREMEEKDGGLPKVRLRRNWSSRKPHSTLRHPKEWNEKS